jgi:hypothetical protein
MQVKLPVVAVLTMLLAAALIVGCQESDINGGASAGGSGASGMGTEFDKPGFVTALRDGRLWVFRADSAELTEFQDKGEPGKHVTRIGAGPEGMTIKAPDTETLDAYLAAMP